MEPYGKTLNVFKRDEDGRLIDGEYTTEELRYLAKLPWEFTEKIDGMNMRVIYFPYPGRVDIRGRGDNAEIPGGLLDYFKGKDLLARFVEIFPQGDAPVCVYGEGFGPGVQKGGGLYGPVKSFAGFDVKVGDIWLDRANTYEVIATLGLKQVPLVMTGPLVAGIMRVRRGMQSQYGEFYAEGLVARPPMALLDRRGARVMCKIKHKELFNEQS